MDRFKSDFEEKSQNKKKFKEIVQLLKKINRLSHSDRKSYFINTSKKEINLITEIVHNFLKDRFRISSDKFKLLRRIKNQARELASKRSSIKLKKKILRSIQGLQLLNILIPLVLEALS